MIRLIRPLIALLVVALLTPMLRAQASLPSGKQIIEQSIEKAGGREAASKVRTRITELTMSIPTVNIDGRMTLTQDADNALVEVELAGMGKTRTGLSNGVVWEDSPMTGVRIVEGAEREQQLRTFKLNSDLDYEKYYESIETVGKEEVDGRNAFKIKLTPKTGSPETRYYDAENFQLLKLEGSVESAMGQIQMVSKFSDYKEFDGLLTPTTVTQTVQGMELITKVTSIRNNVEIAPGTFELPESVKQMLNKPAPAGN
ncbi:MAG TPA: hypothetical protein PKB10_09665 [Tepidisphaeraceae bacterium]|nr:hypothetical protein [Tepidisphaeraceae bacterium]